MAVVINDFEIITDTEDTRSQDPTRPNGEPPRGQQRDLRPIDVLEITEWDAERRLRVRAD